MNNAPSPEQPKRSSHLDTVFSLAFLGSMLVVAVVVGILLRRTGCPTIPSAIIGACAGVLGVWFVARAVWMAAMCITRGAPFRAGDRVEITAGQHRGAVGEVIDRLPDRCAVRVSLGGSTDKPIIRAFDWDELRRTEPTKVA